jgi:hypothetical protein
MTLGSVRVRPQGAIPTVETRWTTLAGQAASSPPGAAAYDTGARLPVGQIDLEFVDANDAASVTLRSRPDSSSDWRTRHSGLFYTLADADRAIRSVPARIARTTDRHWIVETSRDGGWKTDRLPRLRLGWHPHELLFLAQGDGPYTLAYGSARAGATDAPVDAVLASLGAMSSTDRVRSARLGAARDLAGTAALTPGPPWRRLILWTVLIAAVLALAALALGMWRDAGRADVQ